MSLQIVSDLHLEAPKAYDIFDITPKAPYLALLGDIGAVVVDKPDFFGFLKRQLRHFSAILVVLGNHEAYHSTWDTTLQTMREFQRSARSDPSLGELVLLDRGSFRLPESNIVVLGCSLFSHIPECDQETVSCRINDFYNIKDWDVAGHNDAHRRDLTWLNTMVESLESEQDIDIVILTHWSPSIDGRAVDPRHAQSSISSAFSTDLSREHCFTSPNTKTWAFGHTHYNCDFLVERQKGQPVRIVTNQRGYYFAQAHGFDPEKVFP